MLQDLLIIHLPEVYCLDGVIAIKRIRDPVIAVIISTTRYLHIISYALTLTTLAAVGLYWWRLRSCVLSCIAGDVLLLHASSVGDIDDVTCSISSGVGS
jgi:hypothetical protein